MKFSNRFLLPFLTAAILFAGCDKTQDSSPTAAPPPSSASQPPVQAENKSEPAVEKKRTDVSQSPLIGTIKKKPSGFGCYAVLSKDWDSSLNKPEKRPYIFILTDEGEGLMNVEGQDVLLKSADSSEKKNKNGKNSVKWIFTNKNIKAQFDLVVTKDVEEPYRQEFEGNATVSTAAKAQSVGVKAACYD